MPPTWKKSRRWKFSLAWLSIIWCSIVYVWVWVCVSTVCIYISLLVIVQFVLHLLLFFKFILILLHVAHKHSKIVDHLSFSLSLSLSLLHFSQNGDCANHVAFGSFPITSCAIHVFRVDYFEIALPMQCLTDFAVLRLQSPKSVYLPTLLFIDLSIDHIIFIDFRVYSFF